MPNIYEIDPDADALIIVRPPPGPFVPWPDDSTASYNGATKLTNGLAKPDEVHIKVSYKHLILASVFFRDCFKWKSTDGDDSKSNTTSVGGVQADGRIHMALNDLNTTATTIVLNIIHGRASSDRVPKRVDLEVLAQIAIVVDRLKVQDTVQIYVDRWLGELQRRPGLPARPGRDLLLWIYLAYVFHEAELFRTVTRLAATQAQGPLPLLPGFPLRRKIIEDIDTQRQEAVSASLNTLGNIVDKLIRDDGAAISGSDAGDTEAFLAGIFLRILHRNHLIWPRPDSPFFGISVANISRVAHEIQTHVWRASNKIGEKSPSNGNSHILITPQVDAIRAGIVGLELESDLGYTIY